MKIAKLLDRAIGDVFPSYQAVVSRKGEVLFRAAGGDADEHAIFDLASLTKPLVTSALCAQLVGADRLALDAPVSEILGRPIAGGAGVTARRLLSHAAGLPAWRPFHLETTGAQRRAAILRAACDTPLLHAPGTQTVYSDVGFLVLTAVIEHLTGERIDAAFSRLFSARGLSFRPLPDVAVDRRTAAFVATEDDPARGVLQGRVNDENAFAMGGVAGHAGLFGTADAVRLHVERLLEAWHGRSSAIPQQVARAFWTRAQEPASTTRTLGWDTPSKTGSSAGAKPPHDVVGHLGFTGTSVWIDPAHEVIAVLLTNRTWPDRANTKITSFRPKFHDLVWDLAGL